MILGLSQPAFTMLHTALSLVGIVSGLLVLLAMLERTSGGPHAAMTAVFLLSTVLTSATGYLFPATEVTPGQIVGAISLAALAVAVIALYGYRLAGAWRPTYIVTTVAALYLNCFVGVVQAFQKVPALHRLAPTGSEPPFMVAQAVVLALMLLGGWLAVRRFNPAIAIAKAV